MTPETMGADSVASWLSAHCSWHIAFDQTSNFIPCLVRTCRLSSFCTVSWQLARLLLTRRIAWSLGDSWASCYITLSFPLHITVIVLFVFSWFAKVLEPRFCLVAAGNFTFSWILAADQWPELRPVGVVTMELWRDLWQLSVTTWEWSWHSRLVW